MSFRAKGYGSEPHNAYLLNDFYWEYFHGLEAFEDYSLVIW